MGKPIAVIAVDPGKRTGVAEWLESPGEAVKVTADWNPFRSCEFEVNEFFDFIHERVHSLVGAGYDVRLVSESFIITINTAKNTQAGWSLELIGVLKFLAHRYQLADVKLQAPSVGKTFGTNGKLKYLGWFKARNVDGVRYDGHANDASRHLATYAAQRGLIFTKQQLVDMADV